MFCANCGNEIKEGELFCGNCGAKVETIPNEIPESMPEETTEQTDDVPKKKEINILAIGIAVVVVAVLIVGGVWLLRSFGGTKGDADTQTQIETETVNDTDKLLAYYQSDVLPQKVMLDHSYSEIEFVYEAFSSYTDEVLYPSGIADYRIIDLDQDDRMELLVIYTENGMYHAAVYEVIEQDVELVSDIIIGEESYAFTSGIDEISLICQDEICYLLYMSNLSGIISDGYSAEISMWTYDGSAVIPVMDVIQTGGGSSDFCYEANHYDADGTITEHNLILNEDYDSEYPITPDPDGSRLAEQFTRYGITIKEGYNIFSDFQYMIADDVKRDILYSYDRWGYVLWSQDYETSTVKIYFNDDNKVFNMRMVAYTVTLKEAVSNYSDSIYDVGYCYYDMDHDGEEELIISVSDGKAYEIYKPVGIYCTLLKEELNIADYQLDFELCKDGYVYTYYTMYNELTSYASYYYVLDGRDLVNVGIYIETHNSSGDEYSYELLKNGVYEVVEEAEFESVVDRQVIEVEWYPLKTIYDIVLSDGTRPIQRTAAMTGNGDYLLPNSNTQYLTMEDLAGFTAEQCSIARNEIYARHGRIFTSESLQSYFESKSWYTGTIQPEDFTEDMLNAYELYNRDLILDYEEQQEFNH